jgi:hypothetical protein
MMLLEIDGHRILQADSAGTPLGSEQDALDLIGEAHGQNADLIAVPATRLHADFLVLRTGMAGAFLQKMQNYGFRFAVVGDISAAVASSSALRDFVYESNKAGRMLFVADRTELVERL